jgi:hypothetical protein
MPLGCISIAATVTALDSAHASGQIFESLDIQLLVGFPRRALPRPHSSDDPHVSRDLLDHRIQPAAQHLLGETEGEPLDGVER